MIETSALSPSQFLDFILHAAPVRLVFSWGPPGIGKSAMVEPFAASVGLECVSLPGSQLALEDLIGVPQITPEGTSWFCPPSNIARKQPYCLFLDELNAVLTCKPAREAIGAQFDIPYQITCRRAPSG